jgi:hypothetical protein
MTLVTTTIAIGTHTTTNTIILYTFKCSMHCSQATAGGRGEVAQAHYWVECN